MEFDKFVIGIEIGSKCFVRLVFCTVSEECVGLSGTSVCF